MKAQNDMNVFITDFDGVICDSVHECLLVTYNAYQRLQSPTAQRVLDITIIAPEIQAEFRRLRPYLKGAEDFIPMFLAITQGGPIASQQDFEAFKGRYESQLPEYLNAFYEERDFLKQHEKAVWLRLNPLFDGIAETLQQRDSFERMSILTTKRQADVREIFEYQQIPFPAEQIVYMKAAGKSQKLLTMVQDHAASMEDTVYFEDQVNFLVASQQHGIGSYLAEWGYVSKEQKTLARLHHIPLITLSEFKRMLRDF